MRYHLFYKHKTPIGSDPFVTCEEIHEAFRDVEQHANEADFMVIGNGWAVARAKLRHEDAIDELEARGWVVWPHILEHTATLEDRHHVGIVPPEAGIVTGDSPLVAARKLYEHSQRWRPLRPTIVF